MINEEGKKRLIADLLADTGVKYDQDTFGGNSCGTTCCMAGYCYIRKFGMKLFLENVAYYSEHGNYRAGFASDCVMAGIDQLGLVFNDADLIPPIFDLPFTWPGYLYDRYEKAQNNKERILVAIEALNAIDERGKFVGVLD